MSDYNFEAILYTVKTTNGYEWCATYPDLPNVVGGGDTLEEAIKEAEENKKVYLEYLIEEGKPIPKPTNKLSGSLAYRV